MAKRSLKDPDLSTAHTVHMMSYLIGGALFIAEDFFTLAGTSRKPLELEHIRFPNVPRNFSIFGTDQIVYLLPLISRHY
ncbi:hypothetical protein YC2023_109930 [Brassica napus]